jgi:hypothetical protein
MRVAHVLVLGLLWLSLAPLAQAQHEMPAPAPPPQDALLDARVGNWVGTGTMMGMPITETAEMQWILGHQFLESHSTSTVTMPDGQEMTFEMRMMTKPNGDGTYTGVYMDSMGMMGEFSGRVEEGNMVSEWTDPMHGTQNRGIDIFAEDGTWTMQFFTMGPDGNWAESGSMTYSRAQ